MSNPKVKGVNEFVNNVVTTTLAFEGDGIVREYVGGYDVCADLLRLAAAHGDLSSFHPVACFTPAAVAETGKKLVEARHHGQRGTNLPNAHVKSTRRPVQA